MRVSFDLRRYEYDLLADRYAELFGPANVRIFELNALSADPRAFLDQLAEFLEIDPWPEIPEDELRRRVNRSLPRRFMGLHRFLNHFARSGLNPYPLIALPPRWRAPLSNLASRLPPPKRPFFDTATEQWIRDRFAASNRRLHERYGIDLG